MKSEIIFNLIKNFFIGGFTIATTSYLATYLSPLLGAIFWSYPLTILPSIFFMKGEKKSNKTISKFLLGTTFALLLLILVTFLLSHHISESKENESLWIPIGKATLGFIFGAFIYYSIIKIFKLEKYFM